MTPRMIGDPGSMVGDASPERAILAQIADLIRGMPPAQAPFPAREDGDMSRFMPSDDAGNLAPDEFVPHSESTRDGVRYVMRRRAGGAEYEALDTRPENEPVI